MKPNIQPMVEELSGPERGRRIEAAIKAAGFTVKKAANTLGVTEQAIYKWFKGRPISREHLHHVAGLTNKTTDYFLSPNIPAVSSPENDLDQLVEMLDNLWPPSEFPMSGKERNELARSILKKYPDAAQATKIINFITARIRTRRRN